MSACGTKRAVQLLSELPCCLLLALLPSKDWVLSVPRLSITCFIHPRTRLIATIINEFYFKQQFMNCFSLWNTINISVTTLHPQNASSSNSNLCPSGSQRSNHMNVFGSLYSPNFSDSNNDSWKVSVYAHNIIRTLVVKTGLHQNNHYKTYNDKYSSFKCSLLCWHRLLEINRNYRRNRWLITHHFLTVRKHDDLPFKYPYTYRKRV